MLLGQGGGFLGGDDGVDLLLKFRRLLHVHFRRDLLVVRDQRTIQEGDDEIGLVAVGIGARRLADEVAQQGLGGFLGGGFPESVAHHGRRDRQVEQVQPALQAMNGFLDGALGTVRHVVRYGHGMTENILQQSDVESMDCRHVEQLLHLSRLHRILLQTRLADRGRGESSADEQARQGESHK